MHVWHATTTCAVPNDVSWQREKSCSTFDQNKINNNKTLNLQKPTSLHSTTKYVNNIHPHVC